jgi:hypothetical protein
MFLEINHRGNLILLNLETVTAIEKLEGGQVKLHVGDGGYWVFDVTYESIANFLCENDLIDTLASYD